MDLDTSGSPVGLTLEHAAELSLPELLGAAPSPELNSDSSSKSHPSPAEISDRREDIKLEIDYHSEADILWLGNGLPTPNGEDIAEYVTAFFDDDGRPNGVTIERAAELLLPILTGKRQQSENTEDQSTKTNKTSAASD